MSKALIIENISHCYDGRMALEDLTLSVAAGEILALLGPSGCGKTTALRLIAGLETLQSGSIKIEGDLVAGHGTHMAPEARGVGLVMQDFALFPHMTVARNISFGLAHLPKSEREEIVTEQLELIGLAERAGAHPHMLSGGEQQRVALARALAPSPRIMLMDEAFSSLDVATRTSLRDASRAVLKSRNVPTLMVTHDAEEALQMGDIIAVMRDGKLVQCGDAASLFNAPADEFVMALFGAVNRFEGVIRDGAVVTPFGALKFNDGQEGEKVNVFFHRDSLVLDGAGVRSEVISLKNMGGHMRAEIAP